jgi:hypothetical protein
VGKDIILGLKPHGQKVIEIHGITHHGLRDTVLRFTQDCTGKSEKLKTGRRLFGSGRDRGMALEGAQAVKPGGPRRRCSSAPTQIRWPGKNSLIPGRFSFMICREFLYEEVILVNRSLFFTPLKS